MLRLQLLLGLAAALRPGSAPARTARRPRPLAAGPGGDVTSADDGFSAEDGGFSAEDGLSAEDAALARELADLAVGAELAARQKKVQKGGANRVAAQCVSRVSHRGYSSAHRYVHALTAAHPSELVRDFYAEASPQALAAIQEAILGLVGSAGDVDAEYRATGASVADLCLRLQMTGYMLRNAEYVIALQQLLRLGDRGALRERGWQRRAWQRRARQRRARQRRSFRDAAEIETASGRSSESVNSSRSYETALSYGPTNGSLRKVFLRRPLV
ncbi:hypothetical protein M885DRAFT_34914 [Pelagophyceae sp. CCMP2097]|nr:hypothetical protein M885DRAFT_34914 [Pelagophyceae sp. CCMP2097]